MMSASENSACLVGKSSTVISPRHHPHPFKKSVAENFFAENPKILENQVSHRFRHKSQFLSSALYYGLMKDQDLLDVRTDVASTYIHFGGEEEDIAMKIGEIFDQLHPFACIQSLDMASVEDRSSVIDAFTDLFGDPTSVSC